MLTKAFPSSGRIIAAQFSVLLTFPCTLVIYKCLPVTAPGGMDTMTLPYAAVFLFTGLLISWCALCLLSLTSNLPHHVRKLHGFQLAQGYISS